MSIEGRQDGQPGSSESGPGTGQRPWWRLDQVPFLRGMFSEAWPPKPSHFTHYLIVILAGVATWQGNTPVTVIAPFQVPKAGLPFSGEIVADALQDGLTSIHEEIKKESDDPRLRPTEMDLPALRGVNSPKFSTTQDPTRFAVEVKGLSYERIVSAVRAMRHNETIISGDVLLNSKDEFILVARTPDGGPWQSVPSPATAEGLKRASRDLAEKILESLDPTLAGAALLKDGQPDHAVTALDRAQSREPNVMTVKLNLCMGLEASHRYLDAMNCYDKVRQMNPGSLEISWHRARARYLYGQDGNREAAIEDFKTLAQQGYNDALLDLGNALCDNHHHEDARRRYEEFIARESRSAKRSDRKLAIAYVNEAVAFGKLGDHDKARSAYKQALQYAPGDVLILANFAVETADAGDVDAGIAQLQNLVEENANSDSVPFAYLQLGALFQKTGDWPSAAEQFRKAIQLRPHYDQARLSLADVMAHEGLQAYALSEYAQVAKLSARDEDRRHSQVLAYEWLGDGFRKQDNYPGAASAYQAAIRLRYKYPTAHCNLGLVLEEQGHLDAAIQEYRVALRVNPKELDDKDCVQMAQLRLGEALVSQGRAHRREGIDTLRNAMRNDVKNLECRFCLAQALLDDGNFVEAASEYDSVVKIDKHSAAAHHGLALALQKQGLIERAVEEFKEAIRLDRDNVGYHADLAHELQLQHLQQEAVAERQIIAQLNLEGRPGKIAGQAEHLRCQGGR
jgi:tetratricopeptide (TPR) repeat protein